MAIDESAGIKDRKDGVVKSAAQGYALAALLDYPPGSQLGSVHPVVIGAILRRGWVEERVIPGGQPWQTRYHLTDAGRAVAEASPAVREWIEGWKAAGR
jgi:hypothetical protein